MRHRKPVIQGMSHVVGGNSYRGRKAFLVAGFMFEKIKTKTLSTLTNVMWLRRYIRKVVLALASFALAILSFNFLADFLFQIGLISFREQVDSIPTMWMCETEVVNAAVAFSGVFDYVGLVVAALFLLVAFLFGWRALTAKTYE